MANKPSGAQSTSTKPKVTRKRKRKPTGPAAPAAPESRTNLEATARVVAVQDDLVEIETVQGVNGERGDLVKNEVVYICPSVSNERGEQERLKAEILRVRGATADAQVYESTQGVAIGDAVEQSSEMLSVELGPGLLGQVYDGLQAPLPAMAAKYGIFLPRGVEVPALDNTNKWSFVPTVKSGAKVGAGDTLGTVQEGRYSHKIMVPFDWPGEFQVSWIQEGSFHVRDVVARLEDKAGRERPISLSQKWPVRKAFECGAVQTESVAPALSRRADRHHAKADRYVLSHRQGRHGLHSRSVRRRQDRASEPHLAAFLGRRGHRRGLRRTRRRSRGDDQRVSAIVRSQDWRHLDGPHDHHLQHLVHAGRGAGGFDLHGHHAGRVLPADGVRRAPDRRLDRRVGPRRCAKPPAVWRKSRARKAFRPTFSLQSEGVYERAGVIETNDGSTGSLTMIGTVSPAGGNFDEPVTQSTLSTVKCFLGLSADRAYKRFYPAVDPPDLMVALPRPACTLVRRTPGSGLDQPGLGNAGAARARRRCAPDDAGDG